MQLDPEEAAEAEAIEAAEARRGHRRGGRGVRPRPTEARGHLPLRRKRPREAAYQIGPIIFTILLYTPMIRSVGAHWPTNRLIRVLPVISKMAERAIDASDAVRNADDGTFAVVCSIVRVIEPSECAILFMGARR